MMVAACRRVWVIGALVLCGIPLAGCARPHAPLGGPLSDTSKTDRLLAGIVVPLVVRSVDISTADGQHAVFFKLSRVPDAVRSAAESKPARVTVEADGPANAEDLAVQSYPGADTLVNRIDMSRVGGRLHLMVELNADDLPRYSVQQMADYIVVRFNAPR